MEHTVANDQEMLGRALVSLVFAGGYYSELGITEDIDEISRKLSEVTMLMGSHLTEKNMVKFADWANRKAQELLDGTFPKKGGESHE